MKTQTHMLSRVAESSNSSVSLGPRRVHDADGVIRYGETFAMHMAGATHLDGSCTKDKKEYLAERVLRRLLESIRIC